MSASGVRGVWLAAGPIREPIETLLLAMLEPNQPNLGLREALLEELGRPAKRVEVALAYLGLDARGTADAAPGALRLVRPKPGRDPWRDALILSGGDCPVGLIIDTSDAGPVVLVHEVFRRFAAGSQELVRRYVGLALEGLAHEAIIRRLRAEVGEFASVLAAARRQIHALDPSVLWSAGGHVRVQLGSPSQTTRNLLREGIEGEHLFVLPAAFVDGRTNFADLEFLVYLNFFVRGGARTRLAGTERQRQILVELLRLTIFGIFDPAAPEQPSFETVQRRYGVPDRETYEFFRLAYELFAVRGGRSPASPVLPLEAYLDYTVLSEEGATCVRIAEGRAVWLAPDPGGCDVRIVDDGERVAHKRLVVLAPRRTGGPVPEEHCRALRFAVDRPRFGVTPLGTSHGFDPAGDVTSLVIWINGKGILVDPSVDALGHLGQIGVAPLDVPYVFLTHVHADHDGGLIERLLRGQRTTIITSDVVYRSFMEKVRLVTGDDVEARGLVRHLPANPGHPVTVELAGERVEIETRWNLHPIPTNGFRIRVDGLTFGYSGDTKYDPVWLGALRDEGRLSAEAYERLMYFFWTPDGRPTVDLLYHEAGIPPIHTPAEQLRRLHGGLRPRVHLVHIADREVPGSGEPSKPELFATHVLHPPTSASRERALVETIRLVSYLYDVPDATLRELLRRSKLHEWSRGDVIIRKGAVTTGEPLHFYVVTGGELAVRDGRRLITRLVKADSFGEWGISHQRGFRVADVVPGGPSQCLQFDEATYWWLVARHPAVQDRINRVRTLLPRLEAARERARLRGEAATSEAPSVLDGLTSTQLAGFVLFGEVVTYSRGATIARQGEPAGAFHILLAGHLQAGAAGRPAGEIAEGEGFGEAALVEGGRHAATVTVLSADAEVLVMRRAAFEEMTTRMPAFAWDAGETGAGAPRPRGRA